MPAIPPALLRRLYVEGSLQNRPDGFEFTLRNRLAPSTILGLGPLAVDDRGVVQEDVRIQTKRNIRAVTKVTDKALLDWPINTEIKIIVVGRNLEPGTHRLTFAISLKEVGVLTLRVEDAPGSAEPTTE